MENPSRKMNLLPVGAVTPDGWLKDQMSLVNALQKRLGSDPTLTGGGKWTGGETLPRYVRGLCLLAGALGDKHLSEKADSFMSAIFDSAEPGGDIGGAECDLASKIEAVKAVLSFYELTGEERALSFLRKFFKNQFNTLSVTPLWYHARARLPEELPAIAAVCRGQDPVWLKELAAKLVELSCNWQHIADRFPYKRPFEKSISAHAARHVLRTVRETEALTGKHRAKLFTTARTDSEWRRPAHRLVVETGGVNVAKAVKYPCLIDDMFAYAGRGVLSLRLAGALEHYHGNATGMFAADPWLAGTSPVRGVDTESSVELLESLAEVLAATGEAACADLMEEIIFNAVAGAALPDMSAVRDLMPVNRISADTEFRSATYPYGTAYVAGVPSRGAIAMLAAYPLFLRSVCLTRENELNFFSYAPCTVRANVGGSELRIKLETGYPFRNTVVFRVEEAEGDVSLAINFRVPRRTTMQLISGGQTVATGERNISVKCILRTGSTFMLRMGIPLTPSLNRDGTVLLMASRPSVELARDGGSPHAVAAHATGKWAYAPVLSRRLAGGRFSLPGNERTSVGTLSAVPYSTDSPPFALRILCKNALNWDCDERGVPAIPSSVKFAEDGAERTFVPFACTECGIAQFPVCR